MYEDLFAFEKEFLRYFSLFSETTSAYMDFADSALET